MNGESLTSHVSLQGSGLDEVGQISVHLVALPI